MNIIWKGSPNFTAGRGGKKVDKVVIHWIVGRLPAADAVFAKANGVSAHYAVGQDRIHQYVKEENTAYHAGVWVVNQSSIGVEHEGGPDIPITDAVYSNSIELITDICRRHGIDPSPTTIVPHKQFKATQCPGTIDIPRIIAAVRDKLYNTGNGGSVGTATLQAEIDHLNRVIASHVATIDSYKTVSEQDKIRIAELTNLNIDLQRTLEEVAAANMDIGEQHNSIVKEMEKYKTLYEVCQNSMSTGGPEWVETLIRWLRRTFR